MKLVFMGTPDFAVPTLRQLCAEGLAPALVYTQPSRRVGRGQRVAPPPVAREAERLGLTVRQPEILQTRSELADLGALQPDLIVTAAFGKIFRRRLLAMPRLGCVNLHPSLLPRYRGLAPIPWAILRGEVTTGVTVYRMTAGVDAGPILLQQEVTIDPEETGGALTARLAELGAALVCRAVRGLDAGTLTPVEQDPECVSFAPRLERDHGRIDWRLPAVQITRMVRALDPWPGTFTYLGAGRVKILSVAAVDERPRDVAPGTVIAAGGKEPPLVAALPGAVSLLRVQPENGRPQEGAAFSRGRRLAGGERFRAHPSGAGEGDHA